jgi:hypothetical protein
VLYNIVVHDGAAVLAATVGEQLCDQLFLTRMYLMSLQVPMCLFITTAQLRARNRIQAILQ